ncbi:hypothetical protein M407DRAFT_27825 [Tulasnella calospora MUT 4182]|uniref:Uncharacterized protein n=1 Tax=Tulasnella calospora MUT 4182 TaxID=1051891 RepID=A0A0C3LMQ7_9AGAM|nr:hypothetical protein M407DRAFT_27825 [Tulasnella calospora MUT 4182]
MSRFIPTSLSSFLRTGGQPPHELPLHFNPGNQGAHQKSNLSEDEASKRETVQQGGRPDHEHSWDASTLCEKHTAPSLRHSRHLVPRLPTQGDRYSRKRTPPAFEKSGEVIFKNGPQPIQLLHDIPYGFDEDTHPEGQLLYSKIIPSGDLKIRVHTDLALRFKKNHPIIHNATHRLLNLLDTCSSLHSSGMRGSEIEACIIVSESSQEEFGYYLANHRDQTIFWLEDVNPDALNMWSQDADIYQHKLTAQYWRHVIDFPHHCSLPPKVWDQLSPLLLLGTVDQEYCDDSTAPKDAQTLARLETFWRQTKKEREADCNRAPCNWICARLWYDLITPRAINYWGTNYARLEKTTVVGDDPQPSELPAPWFVRFLCFIFLWNEPAATMKLLDKAWPGGVIYSKNWTEMTDLFTKEWEWTAMISVPLFLGATAFLTLGVTTLLGLSPNADSSSPSIAISLASFCGVTCCALSIASLIGAVSLRRAFRGKMTRDVHAAGAYIRSLYKDRLGYLGWGICFSLPRVFLLWAFVFFCGGLFAFAFELHRSHHEFFLAEIGIVGILIAATLTSRRSHPSHANL